MTTRIERDALGTIEVEEGKLWGAQTERARAHFQISTEVMPSELIWALAVIKQACAQVNGELGELDKSFAKAIEQAAREIQDGLYADQFPVSVWQSGSGSQSNMNMNEV